MSTKVQHKMYLPGYYPTRDLNNGTGNGSWPSHYEDKTFGQYYGIFSAQPAIDGYVGHEKEQLRQTILKHEMIFRQQLHELHRLYKIQADMMNEVRSKEPQNYLQTSGTSQSRFFAISSSEDKTRWHGSSLPTMDLTNRIPSALVADSIQSQLSSMKLKTMESGCGNTWSEECEFRELRCKKLQRRLFNLELPADECVIDVEEEGQGASGGSGVESCIPNRNREKISNASLQSGDALSSCLNLKRNTGFADLNEPAVFEEASGTASVDILGNITSSTEHMQRRDLSASSCSGILGKETSQSPSKEKDRVGLSNLHLENGNRKGEKRCPPYTFNSGETAENRSSQNGDLHCDYLSAICESSHIGSHKAEKTDQNRRQQSTKKTIFGLEICETNNNASFIAKGTHMLQPLVPKSNVDISDSSSISSWRQNLTSVHGSSSIKNTFRKSDNGSGTLMHRNESGWDRLAVNNHVRTFPSSKAELSHQNSIGTFSQLESKESQVFHGSLLSFGCPNGVSDSNSASGQAPQHSPAINIKSSGWLGNSKSVDEANAVFPKSYQNEAISDSKRVFVDDLKKEENLKGGLSWLTNSSLCNGKHSEERVRCHHENLDFLQYSVKADLTNSAYQNTIQDSHIHDVEKRRTEGADNSSNKVILGVPIFEKETPKDLSSASSMSKPCVSEVEFNGVHSAKHGLLLTDLNHDPISSDDGEVHDLKNPANEEVSVVCKATLRDCFDLNVSMTEEEAEMNYFSSTPKTKITLDIDLEAPVVLETYMDTSPFDVLKNEPGDCFMRVAADALIAISSSIIDSQDDATHPDVEASLCDSLQWFAEIVSSNEFDLGNDVGSASVGKGSRESDSDDSIRNGFDYFEYMTLNLTETKLEEYHYEVIEYAKEEVALPRRGRRAQARRGRQRKDFQRDVLPGIVSLSRNDVTEDLHTIEGLIRATGGIWQSSLSLKSSPRGKGRGRKRLSATTHSPPITTVSPSHPEPQQPPITTVSLCQPQPQVQQPKCGELGLEETRLTGWGKRTRRPPRQRCLINHPSFPMV